MSRIKSKAFLFVLLMCLLSGELYAQTKSKSVFQNDLADTSDVYPPDMERNYDQLLMNWRSMKRHSQSSSEVGDIVQKPILSNDSTYMNRLYALPTKMELAYNPIVKRYIENYLTLHNKAVSYMLGASKYYFPIIEKALDKEGVPLELKYLPIIESALNPIARSRAGATGLWQFMIGTGKIYDLEINSLVDERRDPVKSSEAAAKYLKDLYSIYNDWVLVLAAYNCGPGNVNKAIRRSGGLTDYWSIYPNLPRETRGYVPAFVAATYVMNYYAEHHLVAADCPEPASLDTVHIQKNLHFGQISELLHVPIEDIREYNPQYKEDIIPGEHKTYVLRLPLDKISAFIKLGNSVYSYKAAQFFTRRKTAGGEMISENGYNSKVVLYKVRRGDTLLGIAHRFHVTVAEIKKWNRMRNNRLSVGHHLEIYKFVPVLKRKQNKVETSVTSTNGTVTTRELHYKYYRIKKGDNWYRIAKSNNLTVKELKKNNPKFQFRIGSSVKIPYYVLVTKPKVVEMPIQNVQYRYTVRSRQLYLPVQKNTANISMTNVLNEFRRITQLYGIGQSTPLVETVIYHKVKSGETLPNLAKHFKVSVNSIKRWNKLSSSKIRIGQRVLIKFCN